MSIKARMAALQSASGTASAPKGGQGKVLHAGWLYKTAVFGSKNPRYCVLYDDPQLSWFDDEAYTRYKGGCSLKGASASINGGLLEVLADSKSSFKHDDEAVLMDWCSRLSAAIAGAPQPSGTLGAPCLTQLVQLAGRLQKLAGDPAATPQIDAGASQQALAAQLEEITHSVERSALRLKLAHFEQLVDRLEQLGGDSTVLPPGGTTPQTHLTYGDFMVTGADPKLSSQLEQLEGLVSRLATLTPA